MQRDTAMDTTFFLHSPTTVLWTQGKHSSAGRWRPRQQNWFAQQGGGSGASWANTAAKSAGQRGAEVGTARA